MDGMPSNDDIVGMWMEKFDKDRNLKSRVKTGTNGQEDGGRLAMIGAMSSFRPAQVV